jgi:hypothetical protein
MGKRDQATTDVFIENLRLATRGNFQITTDGFQPYKSAISTTLSDRCDFAQLIKVYRTPQDGEKRYSPAEVAATEVVPVMGRPDPARICTSIVERSNLWPQDTTPRPFTRGFWNGATPGSSGVTKCERCFISTPFPSTAAAK